LIEIDWKTHENNYYECSKYRGQPQSQLETKQSRAREALKKYLHYFERVRIILIDFD
jgi:ariadne-2